MTASLNANGSSGQWWVRHSAPIAKYSGGKRCYGQLNIALDPILFVSAVVAIDAAIPQDVAILSSPSDRCLNLAHALSLRGGARTLQTDDRLQELNFGRWEGLAWDDIPREEIDAWAGAPLDFNGHGGESVRQLAQRVTQALNDAAALAVHQAVVCVTHNGPIRVALTLTQQRDLDAMISERGVAYGEIVRINNVVTAS